MSELILEGNQFGTGLLIEEMLDVIVETSEENGRKKYYATGLFSEADVMLRNPRIYKKYLLEREIDKFQHKISNGNAWGELEHPNSSKISADRVCMIVKSLEWEGNKVIGKAEILENDMGAKYLSFLKAGKPGVSSRAKGTVDKNRYVKEDLDLICWDGVLHPSANSIMYALYESHNAEDLIKNGMSEEQLYNFVKDIEKDKYFGLTKKEFEDAIIGRFSIMMNNAFAKQTMKV